MTIQDRMYLKFLQKPCCLDGSFKPSQAIWSAVKKTILDREFQIYQGVKFAGFFPTPYVVAHLTFVGEGGMGGLFWARIFLPNLWS